MKKRLFTLIIASALLICSCNNLLNETAVDTKDRESTASTENVSVFSTSTNEDENSTELTEVTSEDSFEDTGEQIETTESETEPQLVDTDYLTIDCTEPKSYTTRYFVLPESPFALLLHLSEDWSLEKQSKTVFKIRTNGRYVGMVVFGSDGEDGDWNVLSTDTMTSNKMQIEINIEKSISTLAYRHRICFTFSENNETYKISLMADYQELSEKAISKLELYSSYKRIGSNPQLGVINIENSRDSVLIVGNSFINSSKIGNILTEMVSGSGKKTQVTYPSS